MNQPKKPKFETRLVHDASQIRFLKELSELLDQGFRVQGYSTAQNDGFIFHSALLVKYNEPLGTVLYKQEVEEICN